MNTHNIQTLMPALGMMTLTVAVGVRMYLERVGEMKERRIGPQTFATVSKAAGVMQRTQAADNFRNLFEVPVLLYAVLLMAYVTGLESGGFIALAWLFVLLRAAHSWIHCTYNRVMHRFAVYLASCFAVIGLWIWLAIFWLV